MKTFDRPFYWPDGNGSFYTYYWKCDCDGSAFDLSFEAYNGDIYDDLLFEASDGTVYDEIEPSSNDVYNNLTFVSNGGTIFNNNIEVS